VSNKYYLPMSARFPIEKKYEISRIDVQLFCFFNKQLGSDVSTKIMREYFKEKDKDKGSKQVPHFTKNWWDVGHSTHCDKELMLQYQLLRKQGDVGDMFCAKWSQRWSILGEDFPRDKEVYLFVKARKVRIRYEWGLPSGHLYYPRTMCRRTMFKKVEMVRLEEIGFTKEEWSVYRFCPEEGGEAWLTVYDKEKDKLHYQAVRVLSGKGIYFLPIMETLILRVVMRLWLMLWVIWLKEGTFQM